MSFGFSLGFAQAASSAGGPSLSIQFVNATTIDPRITFTRASSATYFDSAGVLTTASTNEPRFDFNPITLIPRGLLIEDARTNLLLNSATLSTQSVTVAAVAHTLSFYGTGTVTLSGASTAGPLVGTGVFPNRVSLVFTPTAGTLTLTVTGTVQYAQLEEGEFASSYIPTTGAAATRQKDVALLNTVSPWYNASESTLYAEAELPVAQDTANRVLFSLSTTSINDSAYLFRGSNQNRVFMSVSSGGVSGQFTSAGFVISDNTAFKTAGAIKVNDGALTLNGATPQTDNILTMPASATVAAIGVGSWNTAAPQAFAWFRQIAYYPRRVANAQLQTITAPTVTASLVASRLSGTAPLAIHLDATGTTSTAVSDPFRQVIYSFDYGDPGSGTWSTDGRSKNTDSGGPLGAHVFETAGTYTVTLTANDGGSISTTSVNITVNNPDTVYSGTNTICIDPTGGTTGGPTGCQYVTSMPTIISNRRYLIRRGQTISSFTVPSTVTGVRIGAYGTGAKPIITGQIIIGNGSTPTVAQWAEDVVISDLAGDSGSTINQCGRNLMLLRCDFVNTSTTGRTRVDCAGPGFSAQVQYNTITDSWGSGDTNRVLARSDFYIPKYIFVVECYQRGNSSVGTNPGGMYFSVDCAALMGNDLLDADGHAHRLFFARKTLIQHSSLQHTSFIPGNHAIKLHSGGTNPPQNNVQNQPDGLAWYSELNVIRRNTLGASASANNWTVAIRPQNEGSVDPPLGQEGVQDTIVEDNSFIDSPSTSRDIIVGPARRTTTRGNTRNNGAIRIDQDNNVYPTPFQTEWRGPYYGQYTAAQTLSPSLFTNSPTFYAPTVTTTSTGATVVNSYRSTAAFGGSGTYTITGVTSGNTLLVMFNLAGVNQPLVSITDNQSGTYTQDLTFTGPNGETFYFYRRSNITNAPTSVTVDWTGNALITCNIFEVSGLDNASPVDATATDTSSTFNSSPSKSITTVTANAAVFGYLAMANNGTFTPDSGWTALPASGTEFDFIVYDNDVGAAGSKTVSGTLGASNNWRWGVIAYKPA